MDDKFRDQINTARRAGYTDAEIVDHLKVKEPKIAEALTEGFSPDDILAHIAPKPTLGERVERQAGIALRGAAPTLIGAGAGALLGTAGGPAAPVTVPAGALVGSIAVPVSDAAIMAYNALAGKKHPLLSESIQNKLGLPAPETTSERMLDVASGAISPAAIEPAAAKAALAAGASGKALTELSRAPLNQLVTSPSTAALSELVTEKSGNPALGLATGAVTGVAASTRPKLRQEVPSAEELGNRAKANYDVLDKSGFQLNNDNFKAHFDTLPGKLRADVGYVEEAYPKVKAVMNELTSDRPKDAAELQALRKIIGGLMTSSDAQERKIASRLKESFDDYVMNVPDSAIASGGKDAAKAWKAAREDYSKVMKGEIFTDIIEKAELSQGDKGKAIASQLSALAKNDKKMRMFTPDEQEEIKRAAKGGSMQSLLNTAAKFTPMTPAAAIFTAVNPWGAYTAAAGLAAKSLATSRQERQAQNLAITMRSGLGSRPPVIEGAMRNLPATSYREAVNALNVLQNQNALAQ